MSPIKILLWAFVICGRDGRLLKMIWWDGMEIMRMIPILGAKIFP